MSTTVTIALAGGMAGVLIIVTWFVVQYNRLAGLANAVDTAWANIDVHLARRHDLVPKLVEVTKATAVHERAALDAVVAARATALKAQGPQAAATADQALEDSLLRVYALSEAYPELKANQSFVELQRRLAHEEDLIAGMRQHYNSAVLDMNTTREIFPTSLVARAWSRFDARQYFKAEVG